ncbi:MAG: class I fructose-bisphosphate aldolase [Acidimicrobiia bacterium]
MGRRSELNEIARAMVAPGKGLLAADESGGTIKKRFDSINVESTEDNRRAYREMLFRTEGAADHISGVILFDETIRQSAADGTPFVELLEKQGIIPGIKVDAGAKPLAFSEGETVTEGLDGLRERLAEYYALGARFAKWRATYSIDTAAKAGSVPERKGGRRPTEYCLDVNAHALARYAALCQEAGIVPIVEPEILMDGDHTIDESFAVTTRVLREVFRQLAAQGVILEGMILKPNMVLSGYDCATQASVEEVAEHTVRAFKLTVPAAVPGIMFLSGGQSDELATAHLDAMNRIGDLPWALSFSYGRALQAPALKAWSGEASQVSAGQAAYLKRARLNGAAAKGEYTAAMESAS